MEQYIGFEYALSCYIRVIIIAFAGQLIGLAICDVMMVRKRKWNALIIWLVVKTAFLLFQYCWVDFIAPGSDMGQVFVAVSNFWSAIITSLMFYYTYEGELLKVVIGLSLSEIMMSIIVSPCILLVNLLEGRVNYGDFEGPFQPMDLLIFVFAAAAYLVVAKIAGSLLRKFRRFQVRYRKFLWCFFFCYLGLSQMPTSFGIKNNAYHGMFMYFGHLVGGIVVIVTAYFIYQRYQNKIHMTNDFLRMQMHLMEGHYIATQRQIRQMENNRRLVAQQMENLTAMTENSVMQEADIVKYLEEDRRSVLEQRIRAYLEELHSEYSQLQAGMYCNDWMVDAVLYCQIELAKRQGIEVDCSLQGYDRGQIVEEDLVQILYGLLDFGIREYRKQKGDNDQNGEPLINKSLKLHMGTVKNQLIIQFGETYGQKETGRNRLVERRQKRRYRMLIKELKSCIEPYGGTIRQQIHENAAEIVVILERA